MAKILVVEDNPHNLELIKIVLERDGFEVIPAEDGLKAIEQTKFHHPDLIMMDMQLPGIDGYETTRRIKADNELSKIPVLAVTAYALPGDEEKALKAGCSGYIPKPIDTRKLSETIKEVLEDAKKEK